MPGKETTGVEEVPGAEHRAGHRTRLTEWSPHQCRRCSGGTRPAEATPTHTRPQLASRTARGKPGGGLCVMNRHRAVNAWQIQCRGTDSGKNPSVSSVLLWHLGDAIIALV